MRKCLSKQETIDNGGQIIHNSDGSVTVYNYNQATNTYYPTELTQNCCKTLDSNYIFDIESQTCRWSAVQASCDFSQPINILVNTKGNDGTLFFVDENENETCTLDIKFDYLFKIKCEDLLLANTPQTGLSFETQNEINVLTSDNENIQAQIDSLNNQIIVLNSQLLNTPYSIECDSTAVLEEPISGLVQTQSVSNFEKTGFGSKTADLVPDSDERIRYSTVKKIYCLTDYGLQAWEAFLGPIRYQAFINADPTSYTCKDVNKFLSQSYRGPVVEDCKIPFGSRTEILNQLSVLGNQLTQLQISLIENNSEITTLQSNIEEITSSCLTAIAGFETLDISMTIEVVNDDNTLTSVFETPLLQQIGDGNLYSYLTSKQNSGFYICGGTDCNPLSLSGTSTNDNSCNMVMNELLGSLYEESGISDYPTFYNTLPVNSFESAWLSYNSGITDSRVIELIKNKKIKLNIKINNACGDFCILMDNIILNKSCTQVDRTDIVISQNPSFDFKRIIDNKKSWVDTNLSREFLIETVKETNQIRQTNYNVNDERLILNSKEIDLDINIATAIETDIWHYIVDNPCILTGETLCNPCIITTPKNFQDDELFFFQDDEQYFYMDYNLGFGSNEVSCCGDNKIDFTSLITTDLSKVTTVDGFINVLGGELIDAKNRQTISSYATLRALYERYLNSDEFCNNNSSGFDYYTIEQFAGLIGNYWIDIIEQVIPATTIWGSVKIYTNTIFDEQKFKYKSYSSLFCDNKFVGKQVLSPINGVNGVCEDVQVITTSINSGKTNPNYTICNSICIAQMNYGSEFIGTVSVSGDNIISEPEVTDCLLSQWSPWTDCSCGTQSRTRTIITQPQNGGVPCGPLSETRACTGGTTTCWYNMQENPEAMMLMECNIAGFTSTTVSINSLIVNGVEYISTPPTLYLDTNTLNWIPANNSIISGCTLGGVTGWTYTNFVDFLNTTFSGAGLCGYSAEIALDAYNLPFPGNFNNNGFYLTYPMNDTFSISTSASAGSEFFDLTYTKNDLLYSGYTLHYYNMTCDLETYRVGNG